MKIVFLITGLGLVSASATFGAVLGTYDFSLSSADAPTHSNMEFGPATVAGLNDVSSLGRLTLSGFGASQDLGQYVQFTFAPDPGYSLTITGFSWTSSRENGGPSNISLRLFDGTAPGVSDDALRQLNHTLAASERSLTWNLPGDGYSSEDGLTLRIYGYGADDTDGLYNLDTLAVFGEIAAIPPVPEPGTVSLAAAGLALFTLKRRFRRD